MPDENKKYENPKIEIVHTWGFSDKMLEKMSDFSIVACGSCACSCSCSCSCSGDPGMIEQIAKMSQKVNKPQ